MRRFLLCTDLDRTLIPNGQLPESPASRGLFKRLINQKESTLAYVTGRHRALIEDAISVFDLPQPDFVIADVGTTIYHVGTSGWKQWDEWDEQIAPDWGGLENEKLYQILKVYPVLKLQEKEKQNRHKLSFYIPLETDAKGLVREMEIRLNHAGIKSNLIWSIDEEKGVGLLDVLPASANKLHAIRFLMEKNVFYRENTVFAGDSGNDLDVLLSDIPSVLVANAGSEVRIQAANADNNTYYVAKGGYLGMNGNYSAGILEGVAHYLPDVDQWLREQDL